MLSPNGQEGGNDAIILFMVAMLATAARLAADPPTSFFRTIWLLVGGLGLATGGWVVAKAAGLDGWDAMAAAWVCGALGTEALLPVLRRWLENKIGNTKK